MVATLPVLAFLARDVGGDNVRASSLLPAGASPHTFEPTPRDVRQATTAVLFLSAGAGLDSWAEGMRSREKSGGRLRIKSGEDGSEGTRVVVDLPLRPPTADTPDAQEYSI